MDKLIEEIAKLRQQLEEMTAIAADRRDGRLAALEQLADSQKDAAKYQYLFDDSSELNRRKEDL